LEIYGFTLNSYPIIDGVIAANNQVCLKYFIS